MPGTATVKNIGEVLPSLSITTSEDIYTFTVPKGASLPQRIELISDQDWLYSHKTGGPYFPVAAGIPRRLLLQSGATVIYVKAATTGGTLSILTTDLFIKGA